MLSDRKMPACATYKKTKAVGRTKIAVADTEAQIDPTGKKGQHKNAVCDVDEPAGQCGQKVVYKA